MNERFVKRMLIAIVMAIVLIFIARYFLSKTISYLGGDANEKRRTAVVQPV